MQQEKNNKKNKESNFTTQCKQLNKEQKRAVDSIEGPVMITAGPGTGKTQVLALRIANILDKTDTAPEQILTLTFTEAGVNALRERLLSIIGITAYRLPVFTFHAFAREVIAKFPEYFSEIIGRKQCSELDRIMIMQKILDNIELTHLASPRAPYHYLEKILYAISELKREVIKPDDLSNLLDINLKKIKKSPDYIHDKGAYKGKMKSEYIKQEEGIEKNKELVILYNAYQESLYTEKLYDYDDLVISLVHEMEKNEELRLILQEEYQYLLADEYQDGNGAQNKVLELLASFHQAPNIFIVGDERQAIYRFQGASHLNFTKFQARYPDLKIITLTENYRSTQSILDTANTKLKSNTNDKESLVKIIECNRLNDEADYIAREIDNKLKQNIRPENIAIFTRTNKELALYAKALRQKNILVAVETKEDILDDLHIDKLLILLHAAAHVGDDFNFIKALHIDCFNINELEIYELSRKALRNKISLWKILVDNEILKVRELILSWAKLGNNVSPAELVSTIMRESGILHQILSHSEAENKLNKLARLLNYLEEYVKTHRTARLREITKLLDLLDEYNVLESKRNSRKEGRIQLMTAHRAKGLEFEHVYVVGVTDGNWGGRTSRTTFKLPGIMASTKEEEESDERNLFYVAMTRAKKELAISYSGVRDDGVKLIPSRFILELPESLLHKTALCNEQGSLVRVKNRADQILTPINKLQTRVDIQNFVKETFLERGLAVTGLNNYLSCPWKYFYRNLLRIPEPQTVPLMFGNAVHRTINRFFDKYSKNENLNNSELLVILNQELEREYFTDKELLQMKKEGSNALNSYYEFYKNSWQKNGNRNIKNEYPIDIFFPVNDIEVRLTGKLDKIEIDSDNIVTVVDYKTGKPKSRNEIIGNTKNSDGDYYRQLVFYKLLLDRYDDGKYDMQTGVIDFIIPDKKTGKLKREIFEINKADVRDLEYKITQVVNEIVTLDFWQKRCDDKKCEYCKLREKLEHTDEII